MDDEWVVFEDAPVTSSSTGRGFTLVKLSEVLVEDIDNEPRPSAGGSGWNELQAKAKENPVVAVEQNRVLVPQADVRVDAETDTRTRALEAQVASLQEQLARARLEVEAAEKRAVLAEAEMRRAEERAEAAQRQLQVIDQRDRLAKLQRQSVRALLRDKKATKRAGTNVTETPTQQRNNTTGSTRQPVRSNHRASYTAQRNV